MLLKLLQSARRSGVSSLICLSLFQFAIPARAQSNPADILAQLKGKPLFLRGLWRRDDLRFTHDGRPVQSYGSGPFTLAGIDVEKVNFSGNGLEIMGRRVGLEFQKGGPRRVRLDWKGYNGKVSIHVAGQSGEDFGPALAAIFAPDLQSVVPSVEQYWAHLSEAYLEDANLEQAVDEAANQAVEAATGGSVAPSFTGAPQESAPRAVTPAAARPTHIAGTVKPPALISQVDPTFSEAARGMRYSGKVEVYLWLETSGVPSHLRVVRAAGMGLDEQAVAAVAAYRFKPATMNGGPVKVDLYVDVNFQIF